MRAHVRLLLLAGSVIPFTLTPKALADRRSADRARVRAHFDSVLVELRSLDASEVSSSQLQRRGELVRALAAYRERGEFPHNYDFPGRLVPAFVDRKTGVRCAVAHLLESTGRVDIVSRVAATNNNVHVADLAGDTAFTAWLSQSGLTLAEAARIQPSYGDDTETKNRHFRQSSTVALSASIGATIWNVTANSDGRYPVVAIIGAAAGAAAFGLATVGWIDPAKPKGWAFADGIVGTISVIVGVGTLAHHNSSDALRRAERSASVAPTRQGIQAVFAPTLSLAGRRAVGAQVRVKF